MPVGPVKMYVSVSFNLSLFLERRDALREGLKMFFKGSRVRHHRRILEPKQETAERFVLAQLRCTRM